MLVDEAHTHSGTSTVEQDATAIVAVGVPDVFRIERDTELLSTQKLPDGLKKQNCCKKEDLSLIKSILRTPGETALAPPRKGAARTKH